MILLTGKGGCGKTTCAAALGCALARAGREITLLSLDPAHNLGDVLDHPLTSRPTDVAPRLQALEADLQAWNRARLDRAARSLRLQYRYLTVASLDPLLGLLGRAPGVEESAAAEILAEEAARARLDRRLLIVDLPPSGQAWRLLALPELTADWCASLEALRRRILDRRQTLRHVLGDDTPARAPDGGPLPERVEEDPVLPRIQALRGRHRSLAEILADPGAALILAVALPEHLALLETRRLADRLTEHHLPLSGLIVNRVADPENQAEWAPVTAAFPDLPCIVLPDLDPAPQGTAALLPLGRRLATRIAPPSS